jgi:hypothetical protein
MRRELRAFRIREPPQRKACSWLVCVCTVAVRLTAVPKGTMVTALPAAVMARVMVVEAGFAATAGSATSRKAATKTRDRLAPVVRRQASLRRMPVDMAIPLRPGGWEVSRGYPKGKFALRDTHAMPVHWRKLWKSGG